MKKRTQKNAKKHEFFDPHTLGQTWKTRNGTSGFRRVSEGQNFGNFQNRKKVDKNEGFTLPKVDFTPFFRIFGQFFEKFRAASTLLWGFPGYTPLNGNCYSVSQKFKFSEILTFLTNFFVEGQFFFWFWQIFSDFDKLFPILTNFLSILTNFC